MDRFETQAIETVWAGFVAYRITSKSGTDGAAGVDRNSSRNRVLLATSPARHDASTARIWLVGVDGDANSNSELTGDVDRRFGSPVSDRPVGELRRERQNRGANGDSDARVVDGDVRRMVRGWRARG